MPSPLLGFPPPEAGFRSRVLEPPVTPLVLGVPHAGTAVEGFENALASSLDVRADADLLVDRLYGVDEAAEPGRLPPVPFAVARFSRFVCDLNRHPDDVSAEVVPEHPAPRNKDGRGFLWAVTTRGTLALARPLTLPEWHARQAIHAAYHRMLAEALLRARQTFGFAILVDGHSMPSVGRQGHADPGHARAEVVPGDRDGTSCSPALSRAVESHFREHGYSVAFNQPYKGGFTTAHHGQPGQDIHAIQIELRRDLYMDELTFAPHPDGLPRIQKTLRGLLEKLATLKL